MSRRRWPAGASGGKGGEFAPSQAALTRAIRQIPRGKAFRVEGTDVSVARLAPSQTGTPSTFLVRGSDGDVEALTPEDASRAARSALQRSASNVIHPAAEELTHLDATTIDEAIANRDEYAARGPVEAEIAELAARWTGAGDPRGEILTAEEQRGSIAEDVSSGKFDRALDAMRDGAPAPKLLYRGVDAVRRDQADLIRSLVVGDTYDLDRFGFSSFTEREEWATHMGGAGTKLIIELEDGRGLPITGISNTPFEREWLLNGRLRVSRIKERREVDGQVQVHAVMQPA